ncbi:MAG: hypothetical protein FJZ93_04815 [Chloroflexi bacterium]|nr:hypothetical protein [Chloroflexota bacterium]
MPNKFLIVCGGSGAELLGQRRILGVSGELHIDVTNEIKERPEDPRSLVVKLDEPIGTISRLLLDLDARMKQPPARGRSTYVQTAITAPQDVEHARFLMETWPVSGPLRDGLAQAPVIGGATVRHWANVDKLSQQLRIITTDLASNVGPQNPLDVWIISSTAGGTGEGVHRFVGALLTDLLGKTFEASIKLNFVRIGPLTYRRVNANRTMLNTFFGIAADAAFELKFKEDFPDASINWFFLDLPDVGIGSRGTEMRAEIIDMAVKSIMLEDLAKDLHQLLINNAGTRMVVVSTGFWGKDFGDNLKYYETLRELALKLKELIEPDYRSTYIEGKLRPEFKGTEALADVVRRVEDPSFLLEKMRAEGWQFPKVSDGQPSKERRKELVAEWKREINRLIAPRELGTFDVKFTSIETVTVEGQQRSEELPLRVPGFPPEDTFDATWLQGINDAHRVRAWCAELLEGPEGLNAQLLSVAKVCSNAQHGWSLTAGKETRARDLARNLGKFVLLLEQVSHLTELETDVTKALDAHLSRPKDLLKMVVEQRDIARGMVSGATESPIRVAELRAPLDRLTGESWLRLLIRAAQQGRRDLFRQEVLRGATGLTQAGLIHVLSGNSPESMLPESADAPMLRQALADRMGRMYDPDGNEYEAPWWQASTPPDVTREYRYRILPYLDPTLEAQLTGEVAAGDTKIRYISTGLGVIGLYVLAFHGVSLNKTPGPDTTSTPVYLLKSLVPVVKEALKLWVEKPQKNMRSGQFEITSAGVIGEPLYLTALQELPEGPTKLTREELQKIGEYYCFYPGKPAWLISSQKRPKSA